MSIHSRFFGVVMGRAVANLDMFGTMADRMPGGSAAAMEEQLFGYTEGEGDVREIAAADAIVRVQVPPLARTAVRRLDEVAASTGPWWSESLARAKSLRETAEAVRLLEEARARFGLIMDPDMTLSTVCQGLVEAVTRLAAHAGLDGLENELRRSPQGTAEFELVSDLRRYSEGDLSLQGSWPRRSRPARGASSCRLARGPGAGDRLGAVLTASARPARPRISCSARRRGAAGER